MILLALPHDVSGQRQRDAHAQSTFTPGEVWLDTEGQPINAHGGGMLYYDQTYYSGNKNDTSAFPTVMTQKQRVAGFRTSVQALARTPYVIGADWFQYYDEPRHGRGDGET
jgi:hypothetical protein